jgi:hypothetical protein
MPILNPNTMKVESKWSEFKRKAVEKAKHAAQWVRENPELVGIATTVGAAAIGGAVKICKTIGRTNNLRKERYNKEWYIYDRSLGMYLHTRRPLRTKDFQTINARRQRGEKLADILANMNILD